MAILKTKSEIKKIEKACQLTDKAFEYICKKIKLGVSEKQLASEIRSFFKKNKARNSFRPIVAFGKNTFHIHHRPTDEKLKMQDIIMFDFGAKLNGYCSDMTRTIFFGSANAEFKKMYQTVLDAQKKAIEHLKSLILNHKPIIAKNIDGIARDYIISQSYPSIPHSLGHGLGVRVHENFSLSPKSKVGLKPGMVFSIEPGIYIENFGGVRIEDLVVLEKHSLRILTHSPKELIEL